MADRIIFRRGLEAHLPILEEGEFGFCTDTKKLYIGSDIGNILINGEQTIPNPPDPDDAVLTTNGLLWYWNAKDGIKTGNRLVNIAPEQEDKDLTVAGSMVNSSDDSIMIPLESTNYVSFRPSGHMVTFGASWTAELLFTPHVNETGVSRELISGATFSDTFLGVGFGDLKKEIHQSSSARTPNVVVTVANANELSQQQFVSVAYCYNGTTREIRVYINGQLRHNEFLTEDSIFAPSNVNVDLFRGNWVAALQSDFHAFRFYNRSLTEQELVGNFLFGKDLGVPPSTEVPIDPVEPELVTNGLQWYWNAKDGIKTGNLLANLAPDKEAKAMTVVGSSVNPADDSITIPAANTNYVSFLPTGHMLALGSSWTAELVFTPTANTATGARELISGATFSDSYMGVGWGDLKKELHQSATAREPNVVVTVPSVSEVTLQQMVNIGYRYNGATREITVFVNGQIRHSQIMTADSIYAPSHASVNLFRGSWGTAIPVDFHAFRFYDRALEDEEMEGNALLGKELGVEPSGDNPNTPTIKKDFLQWYWNAKDGIKNTNQLQNIAPSQELKAMTIFGTGSTVDPSDGSIIVPASNTSYLSFLPTGSMVTLGSSWTVEFLFTPSANNGTGVHELMSGGTLMDTFMGEGWGDLKKEMHQVSNARTPNVVVSATSANEIAFPEFMCATYTYDGTTREMNVYINGDLRHTQTMAADTVFAPSNNSVEIFRGNWQATFQAKFHAFRYYSTKLTSVEVAENFLIGKDIG